MEIQPRAEHVWVALTGLFGDQAVPGVLLGWRLNHGQWEGWVISVQPGTPARGDGPYVRQTWLPAGSIRRLDARPPPATGRKS